MKLDELWIKDYKNLKNFKINFAEKSLFTVIIGWNGTGKSNLFEALVIIFRNLVEGETTNFAYRLKYICHNHRIEIDNDPSRSARDRVRKKADPIDSKSNMNLKDNEVFLPNYIFGYYSGTNTRLQDLFIKPQRDYYYRVLEEIDPEKIRSEKIRRFFYAENFHGKFALLGFFYKRDKEVAAFLEKYFHIVGLESVLFIMKKPSWKSKTGDPRFWNARGLVQEFLDKLYDVSLAPMRISRNVPTGIAKRSQEEFYYLYVKDIDDLSSLAKFYKTPNTFFTSLESTHLSEILYDVKIRVKIRNQDNDLSFRDLSEGEQQLFTVLGLLRFTREDESLILLDEPDTHLNPFWSVEYLNILRKIVDENKNESDETGTRHIIMATHDPLVLAGLTKEQIQILKLNKDETSFVEIPTQDPKGLGFTGILTSDMFGFRSDLDPETLKLLDDKVVLTGKEKLSSKDEKDLKVIDEKLEKLGFMTAFSDPYYSAFVKAWSKRDDLKDFQKPILSREEREKELEISKKILEEILAED